MVGFLSRYSGMQVLSNGAGPAGRGTARRAGPVHHVAHRSTRPVEDCCAHADRRVAAERQRIAGALHDDVSSLLFAAAVAAAQAQTQAGTDTAALTAALARVGEQVLLASDRLRDVLHSCTPVEPVQGVPVAVQRDLDEFGSRTGTDTHLVVRGRVRALPPGVERAALNCLRQALFNVERHARAGTVVVTVEYAPETVTLVVQDDGRGLPVGFEPRAVPDDGRHWGYASMARQVERCGGGVDLADVEDGGTRLRVSLPG